MKFKPNAKATRRTKNRFSEHTIIRIADEGGLMSEHFTKEFSENVSGLIGKTCRAFCSTERDSRDDRYPRWFGWIPVDEIELVEGE